MRKSFISSIYALAVGPSLLLLGVSVHSGEVLTQQEALQNARNYLLLARAPKPHEIGTPVGQIRNAAAKRGVNRNAMSRPAPTGIAYATPGNDRLALESYPGDAPSRARVYTACTAHTGVTYYGDSKQYRDCMDSHVLNWNTTSPSNYGYSRTGRSMLIQF